MLHQPGPQAAVPDKIAAPSQSTQAGGGEGQRDATTRQEDVDGLPEPLGAATPALDLDLDVPPPEEPPPEPVAVVMPHPYRSRFRMRRRRRQAKPTASGR